jgi:hypothetical protein
MRFIFAILLAYAMIGIYYVRRDLGERNLMKLKGYVITYRSKGGVGNLITNGLVWPIGAWIALRWSSDSLGRKAAPFGFFLLAIFVFHWLISN